MAGSGAVRGDPSPDPTPIPAPVVLRWGLPDALIVWLVGLGGALVGAVAGAAITGVDLETVSDDATVLAASAIAQFAGMGLALWLVARIKGRGSLASDFGFTFARKQWWFLLLGLGTQIAAQLLLAPIAVLDDRRQGVVEDLEDASGAALALLAVTAVLVAPVIEELLFRGLLLRALLRRMPPVRAIGWSAGIFGAVHLVDPSAIVVLPALVGVGVVAGVAAVRTGSVGAAIAVHAGFNLVTVLALLVA